MAKFEVERIPNIEGKTVWAVTEDGQRIGVWMLKREAERAAAQLTAEVEAYEATQA